MTHFKLEFGTQVFLIRLVLVSLSPIIHLSSPNNRWPSGHLCFSPLLRDVGQFYLHSVGGYTMGRRNWEGLNGNEMVHYEPWRLVSSIPPSFSPLTYFHEIGHSKAGKARTRWGRRGADIEISERWEKKKNFSAVSSVNASNTFPNFLTDYQDSFLSRWRRITPDRVATTDRIGTVFAEFLSLIYIILWHWRWWSPSMLLGRIWTLDW